MENTADIRDLQISDPDVIDYILGVVGIVTSAVWLVLHLALRARNVSKDVQGIKKILKIKCYIMGSFEIIGDILGIIFVIQRVISGYFQFININIIGALMPYFFLCLIFECFKIHGVRKDNNRFDSSTLTSSSS